MKNKQSNMFVIYIFFFESVDIYMLGLFFSIPLFLGLMFYVRMISGINVSVCGVCISENWCFIFFLTHGNKQTSQLKIRKCLWILCLSASEWIVFSFHFSSFVCAYMCIWFCVRTPYARFLCYHIKSIIIASSDSANNIIQDKANYEMN